MKIFKIIELLKDKDNWIIDSGRFLHKPTGVYFFTGIIIWNKEGKEIYSSFLGSTFILPFFISAIQKHIQEKETDTLDKIYNNWKANY